MPSPRLFGGFRGPFEKWWPTDCCTQQFSRGFGYYTDQNTPLKGENKRKCSDRLASNGLEILGLMQQINCSRTKYSNFLKEKAYPNVGN